MASARIAVFSLAAINIAGALGLAWFVVEMLRYDGVMVFELSLCAGLIAAIALVTVGGLKLQRAGKTAAAIALLAVAAVPTTAAIAFLVYLNANPIDWR